MKKSCKILLLCAGILIMLVLLAAVLISPLAKRYIERNGKELVGRTVRMDKLRFNLFTGNLRIEGFRMLEADDSTVFIAFDRLETGVKLRALPARRIIVRRFALHGPDITLYQRGSRLSIDDILAHFADPDNRGDGAVEPTSDPWEIGLYDISIEDGHLFYKDLLLDAVWEFNDLGLTIPGVYFAGPRTDVGLLLQFAGGGTMETTLAYDMEHADFDLRLRLQELSLEGLLPYLQQTMQAGSISGRLSADLQLAGNMEHLSDLSASGTARLCGFRLEDTAKELLLAVDTLHLALHEGDLRESRLDFDRICVAGPTARYAILPNGSNNLSALFTTPAGSNPSDSASSNHTRFEAADRQAADPDPRNEDAASAAIVPASKPLQLTVGELEVRDGSVTVSDRSLVKPFDYRISDIRLHCRDFNPDHQNSLTIAARMQRTGSARIRWQGSLNDLDNQDILVTLSNIDLRDFSPYCEQFTAYPLSDGNLSFRSQNIIANRRLDGTNHLDMYRCTVGKKRKDHKPEFRIPLRLGLYVLKDKKGHVKIDLPVKGDLDAPEFSYRKIVMKALGNVLLKVVTAPFSFLSGNGDNLTHIDLEPLSWNFSTEQYARFDRIADLLREKPEMKVALTQRINHRQTLAALAEIDLKTDFHCTQGDSLQPLGLIEYEKIRALSFRTEAIHSFADSLLRNRGVDPSGLRIDEKAMTLYGDKAAEQLRQLMLLRNKSLREYMSSSHGIGENSFRIDTLGAAELRAYAGKNRYTIAVEMDGETYEVDAGEEPDSEAGTGTQADRDVAAEQSTGTI